MKKVRKNAILPSSLFEDIREIIRQGRNKAKQSIDLAMVQSYWLIGRRIVEDEQQGEARADYGKSILINLSKELTKEFRRGFSVDNLANMRRFYLEYSNSFTPSKSETPSRILKIPHFRLSWSHYVFLTQIKNLDERNFYEIESLENNWSLSELKRQFNTALYTRLSLSKNKEGLKKLSQKGQVIIQPEDAIKDPYILEFLDLKEEPIYSESDLESALIDKLEHFLLELGKGYTFVARQKRITFDDKHFRIDLVFYNRILRCFVVIDLKIGELQHQDIGQMQMYVNYCDRFIKLPEENKTIGIILCQKKSELLMEVTLPENNKQIFASRYQTVLPSKEELSHLLENKHDSPVSDQDL